MHSLPAELHSLIFSLAISLDHHAHASLTRTCRYFYTVAFPLRFQSVCLSCPSTKTLQYLSDSLNHASHHVRDLYISDAEPEGMLSRTTDLSRPENVLPLTRILSIIAPTIERLTFISSFGPSSTSLIGHLYSLRYPRLVSLAILGFYPIPRPLDLASNSSPFPNVEDLWLSGNRNPSGLFTPGTLDAACPSLKRLTLHGVYAAPGWALEVQRASSPPVAASQPDPCAALPQPRLPSSLREIIVHPGRVPPYTGRVTLLKDEEMRRVLGTTSNVTLASTVQESPLEVIRTLKCSF